MNKIAYSWSGTGQPPSPGTVTLESNRQLVFLSGSGYSQTAGQEIGVRLMIGAEAVSTCSIFANQPNVHVAMPAQIVELNKSAADYPVSVEIIAGTSINNHDRWCVTIAELDEMPTLPLKP